MQQVAHLSRLNYLPHALKAAETAFEMYRMNDASWQDMLPCYKLVAHLGRRCSLLPGLLLCLPSCHPQQRACPPVHVQLHGMQACIWVWCHARAQRAGQSSAGVCRVEESSERPNPFRSHVEGVPPVKHEQHAKLHSSAMSKGLLVPRLLLDQVGSLGVAWAQHLSTCC